MSRLIPVPPGFVAAIVTYLEMFGLPEALPEVPVADLALQRVLRPEPDDYLRLFRRVGEEWLWVSRLMMTKEQLRAAICHPDVHIYAATAGGKEVGLVELDWRDRPYCEIVFFGTVPEVFGTGIGSWMMGETQRLAFAGGASRLWLHTCTLDHPKAVPFYLRHGFEPYKREIELAPDPRVTGEVRPDAAGFHPIIPPLEPRQQPP